jgi:propanol-preferring alcohol dehydrogenase
MTNSWAALPYPTQTGQVGGHEGIGKVVKLGPGAEASGVKIGDRVGVKWISAICECHAFHRLPEIGSNQLVSTCNINIT